MNNVMQGGKSGGDASGMVMGGAGASSGAMGGFGGAGGGWGGGVGLGGDAKSSSDANVGNTGGDASDNTSIGSVTINS